MSPRSEVGTVADLSLCKMDIHIMHYPAIIWPSVVTSKYPSELDLRMTALADRISIEKYAQAESPRWTAPNELAWVDLITSTLHVGRFSGGVVVPERAFQVRGHIGSAARVKGSEDWLVGAGRAFHRLSTAGESLEIAALPVGGGVMNDGVCDATGRFWSGTQAVPREPVAALYSLETDGTVVERLNGVTVSNGICLTPDARTLYYIDTLPHRTVDAFDIGPDGTLSGRRTVARIDNGNPDGMAIDEDGCLWVAVWDAGEAIRLDPRGRIMQRVRVPALRPTAVALAGDILVITTASVGVEDHADGGGYLYAVAAPSAGCLAPRWG
ncbi:SMP-30/gluconolactonase/LRE family protein [Pseudarthrobacter sp. 1C304]|uniref:SMP-30/gluconolactonase/LRE family protein n=1 Tax=Pseudarthrobacter sp. 1C304 TaxID=3457438 RepID=UPI003FD2F4DB